MRFDQSPADKTAGGIMFAAVGIESPLDRDDPTALDSDVQGTVCQPIAQAGAANDQIHLRLYSIIW